ncbi:hypothetical protein Rhe02_35340 [Rhizocola hellebori]|uniref:WD40 repeat domain-containing protein n=1 Tax=Rhizocola hellebori TaxID=1392758 RepID=A0A8J3Q943_9ACTN|nr:hypothetical protein [Rhizocola hellebori]GIH05467.1 hypothetical protein Rhe02_35340 [Rhizocola hellebori]
MARATSGKYLAALAVVALTGWGTGCSAPPAPDPAPEGLSQQVCFGPEPAQWAAQAVATTTSQGLTFGVHAVAGEVVFGQFHSSAGRGVGALDPRSGKLTTIGDYAPGVSGLGAMAAESPWIVWEQLNSKTNLSDWSVHAFNQDTGDRLVVATSAGPDGGYVAGQQPLPALAHGIVAWAQPVRGSAGTVESELKSFDLAARGVTTLDTGRLSSPVFAGPYLLWAKVDSAMSYTLHAVDAKTLRSVELPEPLRHPASVAYLSGSPDYLAWSSQDLSRLDVWHFGTQQRKSFTVADRHHAFQFLHLAGGFLLWYGGTASSVLDLSTGAAFDVAGTVTGSADWIVTAQQQRVARIATPSAPRLHCPP